MKSAATVLQELLMKLGERPEYECVSQRGPQHLSTFDYQCVAFGETVTASAQSKKEAKQSVARLMLQRLSLKGHCVPPPFGQVTNLSSQSLGDGSIQDPAEEPVLTRSYVALLKELCDVFLLPAVEYELVGDTGPPHQRHFTIRARMNQYERCATSTTKKNARQHAAEQLYNYLKETIPRIAVDFDEKEALVRAHEKAMDRYVETSEDVTRRPDLSIKISEYHLGLFASTDKDKRAEVQCTLIENVPPEGAEEALLALATSLGLTAQFSDLECQHGALCLLELVPTSPTLVFAGAERAATSLEAICFIRLALCFATTQD